ncbi:phage tail protein [uncultured Brachyspira sp.]|uniref:phage tail protein n=1 Tax=uncultured Brachyspira sp. TaxID=221953 RepID=UPI0026123E79|nr:phage tail protein [uncultured Brachyspira sp.]
MINKLNENNIQAPFQYKISENTFELLKRNGELELNTNNVQVKVFPGQRLFCADIGYGIDGAVEEMEFLIDDIKVYPQILENLKALQNVKVKDNEIYLVRNEIDFKSIVFFPPSDLNKNFKFTITTYSSTFSSFMFDEIAEKLNTLDTNYPVKNYYENIDYKVNDIVKNNGYLYRVFKEFTSDSTDYYLKTNCNLLTPFKKLELDTDYKANELIEYNNDFLIVQKDFRYENKDGVLTDLSGLLKPLQDIAIWFDGIAKIYKNQIIIKDNFSYIVLEDIENPVWGNIQNKIDYLNKAENIFYDDSISFFGDNTDTVQKALEKLQAKKQNNLILGNNININENKISVNGGTNKKYASNTVYYIDDLIIYDGKLYKVNEDFIAANWNADISKCTLVSGGGSVGSNDAIDIIFDNSKSQLQQLVGYDYPKYKKSIPSTVSIVLSNGNNNYNASIVKQSDGSYRLKCNISNFNISGGYFSLSIKNVNNLSNIYQRLSFLSQFFNIQTIYTTIDSLNYINLEASECVISSLNFSLKFALIYSDYNKSLDLIIKIDSSSIQSGSYNITLNIKNRVLRQEDRNIFAFSDPFMGTQNIMDNYIFSLSQNNSSVKLTGSYTLKKDAGLVIGFYSPIIENYFNVSSSIEWKNTTGITSSSKKPLKFSLYKNNSAGNERPLYLLFLMYQDETDLKAGEKITFYLTPDKNSTLGPIYKDVTNVQQLGEVLSQKDTELLNKINGLKAANIKIDTISGLNASNVQQAIAALNQKIYNIYDTSRKVPINDYALINNKKYNFYRVFCVKEVELIEDGKEHMLAVKYDTVNRANIVRHSITLVGGQKTICFSGSCSAANGFDLRVNIYSGELQLYYTIYSAQSFSKIIFFIDYY